MFHNAVCFIYTDLIACLEKNLTIFCLILGYVLFSLLTCGSAQYTTSIPQDGTPPWSPPHVAFTLQDGTPPLSSHLSLHHG